MKQEEKVVELYEKVATMQITPYQAKVEFMKLLKEAYDNGYRGCMECQELEELSK